MELERLVGDVEAGVVGEALGHGAELGRGGILGVESGGGAADHQAGRLQLRGHVGQPELQPLKLRERPAELAAGLEIVRGGIQSEASPAERTGGDIQPATIRPGHGDEESLALVTDPIFDGNAYPIEVDHGRRWLFQPILRS